MFLVCGEAVIDLFQETGGKLGAESGADLAFAGQPAGSPFNVAVGLARMGCAASFFTGLSRDAFGAAIRARLSDEGVEHGFAPRTLRPTILSFVLKHADETPAYAFYGHDGADFDVTEADLPLPVPSTIHAVHAGGFPTAISPAKEAYATLLRAAARDRFVSFDPNVRATLMGDLQAYRTHLEGLLPSLDLIKASTEDVAALYPGADMRTIPARWLEQGAACVVLTDGANGAAASGRFGSVTSEGVAVAIVDSVGAGDSFMAALLAQLDEQRLVTRGGLRHADAAGIKTALGFANRAAAITCTRRGANPPRRAEVHPP